MYSRLDLALGAEISGIPAYNPDLVADIFTKTQRTGPRTLVFTQGLPGRRAFDVSLLPDMPHRRLKA